MEIRKMNTKINIPGFTRLFKDEIIIFHADKVIIIDSDRTQAEALINTPERNELITANSINLHIVE